MATGLPGRSCTLKVGTDTVSEIRDLTLTMGRSEYDVSARDSGEWTDHIVGRIKWGFSGKVMKRAANSSGFETLYAAMLSGALVSSVEVLDAAAGDGFSGSVYVTQLDMEQPEEDGVSYSLTVVGTGTATRVTNGS